MRRRDFLKGSVVGTAAFALGRCGPDVALAGEIGTVRTFEALEPTAACEETEANILGPFYKTGAPERASLVEADTAGTRLTLTGRVLSTGCAALGGALLDVWQADDAGAYDNLGYRLRGKVQTAADGAWRLETIVPGRYLNGSTYRPAHIHVRVSAPGHVLLTTQLYFQGDPYNASDPWFLPSLALALADTPCGAKQSSFDFVLRAA